MVDTIKTIGVGGDYLTLQEWHSATKNLDNGNRQVGELLHSIDVGGFLRFDGAWPNGGLLRGSVPVNGVKGQGCVITNTGDGTRNFLETPVGFEFEDLEFSRESGYAFQNLESSIFTRCIVSGQILVSPDNSPVFNYCVLDSIIDYTGVNSAGVPKVTLNHCILTDRVIARAEVDVDVISCVSLASDSFLTYTGNTINISNSFFRQLASGDKTGIVEDVVAPYYELTDFVDYAAGDYRLKSDSTAGAAGAGAFIQQVEASDFNINASFLSPASVLSSSLSNDAPGFDVGAAFTAPSVQMSSSLSAVNPEFNLSAGFVAPSSVLSASISSDTPEINLSASFSAPMSMLSASLAGDVPEFNLSASFVVPHVTSAVYLSAELPEFDVSVSMATPIVELSSSITTSVDDVDLSASFTVPSAVLGAVLINGDIIKITPTENIINSKPKSRMLFTKDRGRYL